MRQLLVKLTIAYDGTDYKGWQDSKMGPSIESTLRSAIEQIQQHPVQLDAASRTDAGVHAEAQYVTFTTPLLRKEPFAFLLSLNALLPPSIRVLDVAYADEGFHPTLQALGKEYHYWLAYGPVMQPKWRWTTWHTPGILDINLMREAANILVGTHDFAAFCNELLQRNFSDTVRTITSINIQEYENQHLCIKVAGTHFLYKMVRNIAGTLVYVGRGRISPETVRQLLQGSDRTRAGMTAPAHGLTLHKVFY